MKPARIQKNLIAFRSVLVPALAIALTLSWLQAEPGASCKDPIRGTPDQGVIEVSSPPTVRTWILVPSSSPGQLVVTLEQPYRARQVRLSTGLWNEDCTHVKWYTYLQASDTEVVFDIQKKGNYVVTAYAPTINLRYGLAKAGESENQTFIDASSDVSPVIPPLFRSSQEITVQGKLNDRGLMTLGLQVFSTGLLEVTYGGERLRIVPNLRWLPIPVLGGRKRYRTFVTVDATYSGAGASYALEASGRRGSPFSLRLRWTTLCSMGRVSDVNQSPGCPTGDLSADDPPLQARMRMQPGGHLVAKFTIRSASMGPVLIETHNSAFNPWLVVRDLDRGIQWGDQDSGPGYESRIVAELPPGDYFAVIASRSGGGRGMTTLRIDQDPAYWDEIYRRPYPDQQDDVPGNCEQTQIRLKPGDYLATEFQYANDTDSFLLVPPLEPGLMLVSTIGHSAGELRRVGEDGRPLAIADYVGFPGFVRLTDGRDNLCVVLSSRRGQTDGPYGVLYSFIPAAERKIASNAEFQYHSHKSLSAADCDVGAGWLDSSVQNPRCTQKWGAYLGRIQAQAKLDRERVFNQALIDAVQEGFDELEQTEAILWNLALAFRKVQLGQTAELVLGTVYALPRGFLEHFKTESRGEVESFVAATALCILDITENLVSHYESGSLSPACGIGTPWQNLLSNAFRLVALIEPTKQLEAAVVVHTYLDAFYSLGMDPRAVAGRYGLGAQSPTPSVLQAIASKHGVLGKSWPQSFWAQMATEIEEFHYKQIVPMITEHTTN